MKRLFGLLALLALPFLYTSIQAENVAPAAAAPQLRDLPIFTDTKYGGWAGSGGGSTLLTAPDSTILVDNSQIFNGNPSYRFDVTGNGGWWASLIAGPLWEAYDLTPYLANGMITFNVRGAAGGETFSVLLQDSKPGAAQENSESDRAVITDYATLTTAWQTVSIPLADLVPDINQFSLDRTLAIGINAVTGSPQEFWLNTILITSPDSEPIYPAVKVNQAGYLPDADKVAVVSGFDGELNASAGTPFNVVSAVDGTTAYSSTLTLAANVDSRSGERVLHADFSAFTDEGAYRIEVAGETVSPVFEISETVFDDLFIDANRYFFLQRQGMALSAANAGPFARGIGTPDDASAHLESDPGDIRDVSQGWYDAGDYGKYTSAGAHAVIDLLWAYELFSAEFDDTTFNISESGNGTPDILDEVRWELDWLLKMQDSATGGFYHMVQDTQSVFAPLQTDPRFIVDVNANGISDAKPTPSTGLTVGALAHAAVVYADSDPAYAAQLLQSAENGWDYLVANPSLVITPNGPYFDNNDADNRLLAAAALYRATGANRYQIYFVNNYQSLLQPRLQGDSNTYSTFDVEMLAALAYSWADNPNAAADTWLRAQFADWRTRLVARRDANPWRMTIIDGEFYWGSNMSVLNDVLSMAVVDKAYDTYDATSVSMAQSALDYIMGVNPLQMTYVTGHGDNALPTIYSNLWSRDDIAALPPGFLAGGPNAFTNPLVYSAFPAKQFIATDANFTTNEHTIYWNSPLVFITAQLKAEADSDLPLPVKTYMPIVESMGSGDVNGVMLGSFLGLMVSTVIVVGEQLHR